MNNLYGWLVTEYLPYERFEWLKIVDEFDVISITEKSPIGYFLEVGLEYPDELHELHNDYPLAPEKLAISSDMLKLIPFSIESMKVKTVSILNRHMCHKIGNELDTIIIHALYSRNLK